MSRDPRQSHPPDPRYPAVRLFRHLRVFSLSPRLWFVSLAVVLFTNPVPATSAASPAKPSILFIMVDTLRADHVSSYGYRRPTTPAIDALAAEGLRFTNVVAASSWTMPSLGTMFTGTFPQIHNVVSHTRVMASEMTTLAAELQKSGYQTAGIVANPLAHSKFGFGKGFDFYDDFTITLGAELNLFEDMGTPAGVHETCTGESVTRLGMSWLKSKRKPDQPFFLFLLYFDPHADFLPPARYASMFTNPEYKGSQTGKGIYGLRGKTLSNEDEQHLMDLYDGEVRYTDDCIDKLLAEMKALGIYDNTLIVLLSDHGEEFWEHGSCTHGHTLYDELVKVPWIMRFPALFKSGQTVPEQVSHVDLMPTLLAIAGAQIPAQCRGRNLLPYLTGTEKALRDAPAYMETESTEFISGVRTLGQKLLLHPKTGVYEFYRLPDDPGERHNAAGTPQETEAQTLKGQLAAWREQVSAAIAERGTAPKPAQLDEKLIRQLKALGYMQ